MDYKKQYKRTMIFQKLIGLGMLALSTLLLMWAAKGTSPDDRDATAVLLTIPIGLDLLFSKSIVINF